MFENKNYHSLPPEQFWSETANDLDHLLCGDDAAITTLANSAAFIFATVEHINWAGYYLYDGSKLVLGPFCGKPACTTIALGSGVCGTAAAKLETVVVDDVLTFPGHIACDVASRSEVVVPIVLGGKLFGVLDIDSPSEGRFKPGDVSGLKHMAEIVTSKIAGNTQLI